MAKKHLCIIPEVTPFTAWLIVGARVGKHRRASLFLLQAPCQAMWWMCLSRKEGQLSTRVADRIVEASPGQSRTVL
ncbi:MAG: hypothetical protein R2778_17680 [Saprospiraceae bacterium]